MEHANEDDELRSAALQTSQSISLLRRRAEQELVQAKQALEIKTEELAQSVAILRATLDATTDGIVVVDEDGNVINYNEQFVRMWQFPEGLLESRQRQTLREFAARELQNPEEVFSRTKEIENSKLAESVDRLDLRDGRVIERFSRIQCIDHRIVGRVWSYRDITHRVRAEAERERLFTSEKEARERAERETRMKDEFLATLSHELRTPLNAILGWANILRTSSEPKDIPEGLEVIERNARAQAQIIEDLLDMSRIISGKVGLDVQQVDLAAVIKLAIESVRPMAAAKGISLTPQIDSLGRPISGDPARLQQVLWNLLTNAVKFTRKGGSVNVVCEQVRSDVEVRITDTGPGISPEFLPHVFDRFRQADASTTRKHGGLGLGLAIVKNLVELHGGEVRAESPGPDRGATFTIALPVAATLETGSNPGTPRTRKITEIAATDAELAGLRVLIVDDELDARQMVKRILGDRGVAVETAANSAEALALLKLVRPHVLITDIGMPDEDGYAVIKKIRQLSVKEGGAVPAIALTAFARAEDRERAIQNGFQMHLAKPVEAAELIACVASLAGRDSENRAHPEFNYD